MLLGEPGEIVDLLDCKGGGGLSPAPFLLIKIIFMASH